ncbi:MAG: hypothetical protein COB89_01660 [Piscirickettsiaceae bacterium]|nr:MAG: hypothetical protein COB89_07185 [Piscirickettsiaceae bacterium]PCH85651.1 MAG: hypothetical protein COB89_01660 [Piscirickettsiaceae bacterium]
MKLLQTTAVAGLLLASGAASALELSGNVALTTDYVWRGVSLSDNGPAVQGGFDADFGGGLYAGAWGSNVEAGDASLELDLYAGWATDYSGVGVDIGIIHYHFSGAPESNTNEVYLGLSFGPVTLTQYVGLDTGVEDTGDRNFGNYTDLALALGSYNGVEFGAHAGFYDVKEGGDDYYDWKLSASTSLIGADWELSYTDTDHVGDFGKADDDKVILTVSKSL